MDRSRNIKEYKEAGYTVLSGAIDLAHIDNTISTLYSILHSEKSEPSCLRHHLEKEVQGDPDRYISILRAFSRSLTVFQLFESKAILSFLSSINLEQLSIPTQPVVHISCKSLTTKSGYFGFEAHQDWPSIVGSLNSVIVWIPLTKITQDDNPLQVIPRSHLKGIIPGTLEDNVLTIDAKDDEFVDLLCAPGDVVVMSTFCVHRTAPNRSGFRIATSLRFNDLSEDNFAKRNFTCAYSRSVNRTLYKENIPSQNDVRSIFE